MTPKERSTFCTTGSHHECRHSFIDRLGFLGRIDCMSSSTMSPQGKAPLVSFCVASCVILCLTAAVGITWPVLQDYVPIGSDWKVSERFLKGPILDETAAFSDLFPLELPDYIGFGCAVLGLMLAAGGGIGGGGILVPIYILLFEFPVKRT